MQKNRFFPKKLTIGLFGLIIVCILLFFAAACSNSATDIISSYDSRFPVVNQTEEEEKKKEEKPGIGEVGFKEDEMLDDEYFKTSNGNLQLRGPRNAAFYKWELYLQTIVSDGFGGTQPELTLMTLPAGCFQNGSSDTTEYFIVYIPMSGLKPGTYVISLTATSKGGQKYSDKAAVIIYDTLRALNN